MTNYQEKSQWEKELDLQKALNIHGHISELILRTNDAAINNANLTLRTLLLLNGGAAVAMLAFLGQFAAGKTNVTETQFGELAFPLVWFAIGAASAALSNGFSYFTNLKIAKSMSVLENFSYDPPYYKQTSKSEEISEGVNCLRWFGVGTAIVSLAVFVIGSFQIYNSVGVWATLK